MSDIQAIWFTIRQKSLIKLLK